MNAQTQRTLTILALVMAIGVLSDGDGSIGIYPRKTSLGTVRPVPCISLTCSLHICLQFKAFLEKTLGLSMPDIVPSKKSYSFTVYDHRAVRAINLLYEDCTIALDRKLTIAKKIIDSFEVADNSRYMKRSTEYMDSADQV
jgi:hypothetical protein